VTRVPLAYEGRQTVDGWYIEPRALRFLRGPVPVTAYVEGEKKVVGLGALFQRGADGLISCEVRILKDDRDLSGMNAHVEVTEAKFERRNEILHLTSGLLRAVHLSEGSWRWPR
jgi:hypothetical protein